KIDLATGALGDVLHAVDGYKGQPMGLVATGCDTEAQLEWAQAVGFDLFIGRAVQANVTTSEATDEPCEELPCAPLPLSQLQLGVELLSRDLDLDRIE